MPSLRLLWFAGLVLWLAPAVARGAPGDARLVASGPSLIHFMVEVPEVALRNAPEVTDPRGAVRPELPGYELTGAAGEPVLPSRVLMVAVPPTGTVRVSAVASGERATEGVLLAPQPEMEAGVLRFSRSSVYATRGPRLGVRARLLEVSWMRNQRVARIEILPADYDAAARRFSSWTRVDVEVAIEPVTAVARPRESSDPFEGVYRDLLVNYEQGRSWRRSARAATEGARPPALSVVQSGQGVFAGREWIKIAVTQTGFFKVDFGDLRLLAPFNGDTSVPLDSLRLYTWPGFPVLPEGTYCDSCDYREVAVGTIDNGDGIMNDNGDAVYFFALGPSDWADLYDPSFPDTVFVNNPYETRSFLYLTVSTAENPLPGRFQRIETVAAPPGVGTVPVTFRSRVHREIDSSSQYLPNLPPGTAREYWQKETWFWVELTSGKFFRDSAATPGIELTLPAQFHARLSGLNVGSFCGADGIGSEHVIDVDLDGTPLGRYKWFDRVRADIGGPVTLGRSTTAVRFTCPTFPGCPTRFDRVGLGSFDFFYQRRFEPVGDELMFDSPSGAGTHRFRIGPFVRDTPPRIFDVTDPTRPSELVSASWSPITGGHELSFEMAQSQRRRYRVVRDSSITSLRGASVTTARATSRIDLRSPDLGADYLVLFYDDFAAAAESLVTWRAQKNGYETMSVPISALYDQFSGGRTDPAAIRNFLRSTANDWRKQPAFVTLLGDASFDFKNFLGRAGAGQPGSLLPSFQNNYDGGVPGGQAYATDDWILNVDNARVVIPDFFGGRITATDVATAMSVVRIKVLDYERSSPSDEFRNRVMLIADDEEQANAHDPLLWHHVWQTTRLDTLRTPQHIDRDYVYLHTYQDLDPNATTKPAVNRAILDGIEDGRLVINYIGHGSPFQLSDEKVLTTSDVGFMRNATRLSVLIAASCDIGKYEDPVVLSLGEALLQHPNGGAAGVISATGDVFSYQNSALNESLYVHIFRRDATGAYHVPLSQALLTAKGGSVNSQKYQLLGDAATRLQLPRYWSEIVLFDSSGTDTLEELRQGQSVLMRGRVQSSPGAGATPIPLEGVASLLIEDAAPLEKVPDCRFAPAGLLPGPGPGCGAPCTEPGYPTDCRPVYYFRAGPIYRGDLAIHGGKFSGRFIVPIDSRLGARGRVRAYVTGADGSGIPTDGVGSRSAQFSVGTAPPGDNEGPRITLAFTGGATSVRAGAELKIYLYDPSGILITGHTLQNGIIITIDDNSTNRQDVTSSFRYAADSYQSGLASYNIGSLAPGSHRIRVSAADNMAAGFNAGSHRSSAVIDFEVSDLPPLRIQGAYLFPNPTRSGGTGGGGQFVVDVPGDSVNVLLRIYTVSGRLIRQLRSLGGEGQVQIPWDGRDAEGDPLANGLYVFKVHVNGRELDGSSSVDQKDSADGRFVIVNR